MRPLHLHEQVMLLALRDEGTMHAGTWADDALGAALLGELLRKCYEWVAKEGETRWTAGDWVRDFAYRPDTRPMTAESLVRLGILKCDEKTVLWIFRRPIYPEVDPEPEARLTERLREVIFADGPVDPRTTVLVAAAHRTGLLEANFNTSELKEREARIDGIVAGSFAGDAAQDAIDATSAAVQAAIFAAVIVPTMIG